MSNSDRHAYITFGWVATIVLAVLGGAIYHSQYTGIQRSSEYAYKCTEQYKRLTASPNTTTSDKKTADGDTEDKGKPDWCDLAAQQSVAESTRGMHWATWATVAFTGFGAFLIWQTLIATQDTLRETTRIGEAQTRAYVHVDGIDFYPGPKVGVPRFIAHVKNSGQTPAKWFHLVGTATVYPLDVTYPFKIELDENIDRGITWNALPGGGGYSAPIGIRGETIHAIKAVDPRKKNYMVLVSGIVRYKTFFNEVFETEFMFVARPLPGFKPAKPTPRQSEAIRDSFAIYVTNNEEPHKMQLAGRRLSSYKRLPNQENKQT